MNRIYTKTGDDGTTSLVGGQRLGKSEPLIESYGTCDELNSFIGLLIAKIESKNVQDAEDEEILQQLQKIQNVLFDLGGLLSTPPADWDKYWSGRLQQIATEVCLIEQWIDHWSTNLEPLRQFLLPGGNRLISTLHICRTVCRRAERCIVRVATASSENRAAFLALAQYANRLSDFFFILARFYHKKDNVPVRIYKSIK